MPCCLKNVVLFLDEGEAGEKGRAGARRKGEGMREKGGREACLGSSF